VGRPRDRQFAVLIGLIVLAVLAAGLGIAFGALFVAPVLFAAAIALAGYGMTRVAAAIGADAAAQRARDERLAERDKRAAEAAAERADEQHVRAPPAERPRREMPHHDRPRRGPGAR
jgi:hypothetical protein